MKNIQTSFQFLLLVVNLAAVVRQAECSKVEVDSPISSDEYAKHIEPTLYISSPTAETLIKSPPYAPKAYSTVQTTSTHIHVDHTNEHADYDHQPAYYKDDEQVASLSYAAPKSYYPSPQTSYPTYESKFVYPSEQKILYPAEKSVIPVFEKEQFIPSYPVYEKPPVAVLKPSLLPSTFKYSSPYRTDDELYRYETYSPTHKYGAYYKTSKPYSHYYDALKYAPSSSVLPEIAAYPSATSYIHKTISSPVYPRYGSPTTFAKYYKVSPYSSSSVYTEPIAESPYSSKISPYDDK